jgi:hypothetical protein
MYKRWKRCSSAKKKMKVERKKGAMEVEEGENITLYEHLDLHSNAHFSSFFVFRAMLLFRQWSSELVIA